MMTIEDDVKMFTEMTRKMAEVFTKKHNDYGQSTKKSYREFGPVSMLTRMSDKFERLKNLTMHDHPMVLDESIEDTLLDLANYCLIFIMERKDYADDFKRKATRREMDG